MMTEDRSLDFETHTAFFLDEPTPSGLDDSAEASDDFWSLLDASSSPTHAAAQSAAVLTRQSRAFTEQTPSAKTDTSVDCILDDAFAARLAAAFQSGALDPRTRQSLPTSGQTPRIAEKSLRSGDDAMSGPRRGMVLSDQDARRHKYMMLPQGGRALYSTW